jgi:hypothetical protein
MLWGVRIPATRPALGVHQELAVELLLAVAGSRVRQRRPGIVALLTKAIICTLTAVPKSPGLSFMRGKHSAGVSQLLETAVAAGEGLDLGSVGTPRRTPHCRSLEAGGSGECPQRSAGIVVDAAGFLELIHEASKLQAV